MRMWGRSIAALCAVAAVAACEETPQDSLRSDDVKRDPATTPAGAAPTPPTGIEQPCRSSDDTRDGPVRCTFSDGRRFDGMIRGGQANGPGKMWFVNGDRYEGTFRDGLFGGSGTYWYATGARYDGEFANGLRNGQGTTVWTNGSRFNGEYRNNKPNGFGTVTTTSGTHSGVWRDGCLASPQIAIDSTLAECGFK